MYLAASAIAVSMLLGGFPPTTGDEPQSEPAQQYSVLCRWVDADGSIAVGPKLTLLEGRKGNFSHGTQTPLVIGVSTGRHGAEKPHVAVIDEGTTIEVTALGRQAGGTTLDVVAEHSDILGVNARETAPGTFVQVPRLHIRKKRVIDFVRFGDVLTIPTGKKGAGTTTPRVELVVSAGDAMSIPSNWTAPATHRPENPGDAQRSEILNTLLAAGAAARVRCERVSRWEKFFGHTLDEDLGPLQDLCDLARLYCACCPHRVGLADALGLLATAMDDPARVRRLDESLIGYDWEYSVELVDCRLLPSYVALLGRVPELWDLVVRSDHYDYQLLHALTKVNVRNNLELDGKSGTVAARDGWLEQKWSLHHDAPGRASLTLDATAELFVEDAESALPALKATTNLKEVFLIAEDEAGAKRMAGTRAALEKALPNVQIDTFSFSSGQTADRRAAAEPGLDLH